MSRLLSCTRMLSGLSVRATSARPYSTSIPCCMPLDEFRDTISREKRGSEMVGRSWSVRELRRKNFDDLHKLWYVLYKERNMLYTEKLLCNRKGIVFPQPERVRKVAKSMGAVKHVLGERKLDRLAQLAVKQLDEDESIDETAQEMDEAPTTPATDEKPTTVAKEEKL